MFKILLVEDDWELNRAVCSYLNQNGYDATGCLSADEAYDAMYDSMFDIIISDIMMPRVDGFEFAKAVRELNQDIPIDLDELLLRIGALLRRAKIVVSKKLEIGSLMLDVEEHTAYLNGEEVPLTVREFNLLYKLLSYPKKTFTRSQLMDEFWDSASASGPRTVDVYMTKLRDKFSDCDDFEIVTVYGLGYKAVLK